MRAVRGNSRQGTPRRGRGPLASRVGVLVGMLLWIALGGASAGCDRAGDSGESSRVELWTLALSPFFDDYMTERLAAFEAAHPGVRVVWVDVPFEALERKLIAAAAAGRGPDVINMSDLNFARFAAQGAFQDLRPLLPGDASQRYLPGVLALCEIWGGSGARLMALPWYLTPHVRIMNRALLEAGGLDPATTPRDWRGLAELATSFHERTGQFLFSQPLGEESQLPIMMLADGLLPLREEVVDGVPRLRSDLLRPEIVSYVGRFVELYRSGALPREAGTRGHAHLTELYQEGRVAIISTGPNFLRRIEDVAPRVFATTAVGPGMVGRLGRVHVPVMTLSVSSRARNPEAAAALAWFLTSPESQLAFCQRVMIMPSTSSTLRDPFFSPDVEAEADRGDRLMLEARRVSAATIGEAVAFTASLESWPDLRRAFEDEMKAVLVDNVPVEAGLAAASRAWDEILRTEPGSIRALPAPSRVEAPTHGGGS